MLTQQQFLKNLHYIKKKINKHLNPLFGGFNYFKHILSLGFDALPKKKLSMFED